MYKRRDLKIIANTKLEDAALLFKESRFSNAYYLAGYAVEIAFKACICKQFIADSIPDKELVNSLYTHDYKKLASLAGLNNILKTRISSDAGFGANWGIVCEWSENSRYLIIGKTDAQIMLEAVANPSNGVLTWIRAHW